jgi:hypothetical protein
LHFFFKFNHKETEGTASPAFTFGAPTTGSALPAFNFGPAPGAGAELPKFDFSAPATATSNSFNFSPVAGMKKFQS